MIKKVIKFSLAVLLTLGVASAYGTNVQANETRKPYNDSQGYLINGYWNTYASINLKLRHRTWFYSKWQHEMKFRIGGGGAVKMDEEYANYAPSNGQHLTGNWVMDDNYYVSVRDRSGQLRVNLILREGYRVEEEMRRLKTSFNIADVKVGWEFVISSKWNDTITPITGKSKNIYLNKPKNRNAYAFTFTDEGLVENASNLRGTESNESLILLPVKKNGRVYNDKIKVTIDTSGRARFHELNYGLNATLASKFHVYTARQSGYWNGFGYGGNASTAFWGVKNLLNNSNLRYGDYITFKFNRYDIKPRLGRNLRDYNAGYYNLTNDSGRLKLTRYGFLTDDGFLVKYTDRV